MYRTGCNRKQDLVCTTWILRISSSFITVIFRSYLYVIKTIYFSEEERDFFLKIVCIQRKQKGYTSLSLAFYYLVFVQCIYMPVASLSIALTLPGNQCQKLRCFIVLLSCLLCRCFVFLQFLNMSGHLDLSIYTVSDVLNYFTFKFNNI